MDFHTLQALFYAVVFIIEVYKVVDHIRQNKKLVNSCNKIDKFIDKYSRIDK